MESLIRTVYSSKLQIGGPKKRKTCLVICPTVWLDQQRDGRRS